MPSALPVSTTGVLSRDPAAAVVAGEESFATVSEDAAEGFSALSLLPQEQSEDELKELGVKVNIDYKNSQGVPTVR